MGYLNANDLPLNIQCRPVISETMLIVFKSIKGCKDFYHILNRKSHFIYAEKKWDTELGIQMNWRDIYKICFYTTRNTSIQWFQYRIIHKIIPTKKYLKMINVERDDICTLCGKYTEDIQHLFFYCEKSLQLWSNLGTFILNKIDEIVNFDIFTVIFGYTANYSHPINLIILLTKYYIYTSAQSKRVPNIFALQHQSIL